MIIRTFVNYDGSSDPTCCFLFLQSQTSHQNAFFKFRPRNICHHPQSRFSDIKKYGKDTYCLFQILSMEFIFKKV